MIQLRKLSIAIALSSMHATAYAVDSFDGLGDLAGSSFLSQGLGVSADGSVVVGRSSSASGQEAFRWTDAGGMVGLGDLAGGIFFSLANGVSADGSVVVGVSDSASGFEAFRWTDAGGMVGLGDLAGGSFFSLANGVNADGSVVVGRGTSTSGNEAFRWTDAGGMVGLGDLAGGSFFSEAYGVNADGSVVVGVSDSASGTEAFRWTDAGGMVGLGDLAGGSFSSLAFGVNADGSVVVGRGNSTSGFEAFRWTGAGGMVGLGDLAGGSFFSEAQGVSADGSVVVGRGTSTSGEEAFRWTDAGGMVRVADWLAAAGVSTTGFTNLTEARGVDASGNTVVGVGDSASGQQAFIARVGFVPPSSGGAVTSSGLVGLTDLGNSLMQVGALSRQADNWQQMMLNSAHHRPIKDIAIRDGGSCVWVSGDVGRQWRNNKGDIGLAEIGGCHDFSAQGITVGLGLGHGYSNIDLANDGRSKLDGEYGIAEVDWQIPNTQLLASLLASYGRWDARLNRGYAIAGTAPSRGDADISTYGLRARLDWQDAFHLGPVAVSPRLAYSVHRSKIDGFQEKGGSAPANFNSQSNTSDEVRIGLTGRYAMNQRLTLRGHAEAVHRFDTKSAKVQGTANALGVNIGFDQDGVDISQDWVRLGAEADYQINNRNRINVNTFVSSAGEDADMILGASWQMLF